MQVKYKALGLIGVVTIVTAAISGWSSYATNKDIIEKSKQNELRATATLIQNDLQEQANKAAARASMVVSLPSIQEAFRKGDRDQLVQRLVPAFLIQRDKYGIREGQFHLAPATSFLRVYDVTAGHGEDLSGFRDMVLATNRKGEAQKGIEIGRRVGVGEGVAIGSGRPVERSGTEFGGELSWAVGCRAVSDPHRQAGEKGGAPDGVGGVEALAAAGNDRRRARRFDFIQQPLQIIQRQERRIDGG